LFLNYIPNIITKPELARTTVQQHCPFGQVPASQAQNGTIQKKLDMGYFYLIAWVQESYN